jgi:hypothetical protein
MAIQDEFTFAIYGLGQDNGFVRADVFASKMSLLIRALRAADKFVNGGKRYDYVIADLAQGSAIATVRERRASRRITRGSSVATLGITLNAIYEGGAFVVPPGLLSSINGLAEGAEEIFSHGEARYLGSVVRIDGFFRRQSEAAVAKFAEIEQENASARLFSGAAITSFDGLLELIDGRGDLLRGKLTLSAGGLELDCVIPKALEAVAVEAFKMRVRISGIAIYDGTSLLPQRITVEQIYRIANEGSLADWKGRAEELVGQSENAWPDDQ